MLRHAVPLAVAITFGCAPHWVTYDTQRDNGAITAVSRTWQGGGLMLSLCEDRVAELTQHGQTCRHDHIVLGDSRTMSSEEEVQEGCSSCPAMFAALVAGQLGQTTGAADVIGEVDLGTAYDADPYAYPYTFDLRCADGSCSATGTLEADGTLHLSVDGGATVDLAPGAAAACP